MLTLKLHRNEVIKYKGEDEYHTGDISILRISNILTISLISSTVFTLIELLNILEFNSDATL